MNTFLSPFVHEILASRDGFGRPVPRQPAHSPYTEAEYSGAYLLRDSSRVSSAVASIYLFKTPYAIRPVPSLPDHAIAYRWRRSLPRVRRHNRASSPQGSSSNECCLCFTTDQLMYASLSHTHYCWWYEVVISIAC